MSCFNLRRLLGAVFAAATLLAAPAAFAQTYTIHRSFTGPDGVTGTATLEMANSTQTGPVSVGYHGNVPAELVSATLTFSNLGGIPTSTSFDRTQMSGFLLKRDSSGTITDVNFWTLANADGYALNGTTPFNTTIVKSGYSVSVANAGPPAPAAVPTMTEWAMIGFALALAGGAALMIQRRRTLSA